MCPGFFVPKSGEARDGVDGLFMRRCLAEAAKGLGFVSPNPMVGAVLVRNGRELAAAWHERDGGPHAEASLLAQIDPALAKGSTLYVNLEPCSHHGRTPPCAEALIRAGIARVVIAHLDPDERVAGRGVELLRRAGVRVDVGLLETESRQLNWIYLQHRARRRPYVMLKAAMSMDGRIATRRRDRQSVSNERCGTLAQQLRACFRAIGIGVGTALIDRPRLDCRLPGLEEKPLDKLIFGFDQTRPFANAPEFMKLPFRDRPGRSLVVPLDALASGEAFLQWTQSLNPVIDSLLIEGGSSVHAWMLKHDIVDRVLLFLKPSFVGGDGVPMTGPMGMGDMAALREFHIKETRLIDNHIMVDLVADASAVGVPCLPV